MPYIAENDRVELLQNGFENRVPSCAGEMNFLITEIITEYIGYHGLRYQRINDVVGALEGAKQEFIRRVVNPYEDTCIRKNGDTGGYEYVMDQLKDAHTRAVFEE